jgi:hypothetical protein
MHIVCFPRINTLRFCQVHYFNTSQADKMIRIQYELQLDITQADKWAFVCNFESEI